jgi:hypothetical protein
MYFWCPRVEIMLGRVSTELLRLCKGSVWPERLRANALDQHTRNMRFIERTRCWYSMNGKVLYAARSRFPYEEFFDFFCLVHRAEETFCVSTHNIVGKLSVPQTLRNYNFHVCPSICGYVDSNFSCGYKMAAALWKVTMGRKTYIQLKQSYAFLINWHVQTCGFPCVREKKTASVCREAVPYGDFIFAVTLLQMISYIQ